MSLRITPDITSCNGADVASADINGLLVEALGPDWAQVPLYMGGDWLSGERGAERAADLFACVAGETPRSVLASPAYSALIRAIVASPAWTAERVPTLADAIKAECRRRIYAVTKDDRTQGNINSRVTDLTARAVSGGASLTTEELADIDTARAIAAWVGGTVAASRALVAASDVDYATSSQWPPADPAWRAYCDRF